MYSQNPHKTTKVTICLRITVNVPYVQTSCWVKDRLTATVFSNSYCNLAKYMHTHVLHNNIPVLTLWVFYVFQDIAKWYGSDIRSDSCAILALIGMSRHSHEWAVTAVRLVECADLTRVMKTCKYHHRNKVCEFLLEFEICHILDDGGVRAQVRCV